MFYASHLSDVKNFSTILRGSCNAGTTLSDEKGWYKGLFHIWLVRNSIANLLFLPQLELEGYRVTYDTLTNWVIHVPDGPPCTLRTKLVLMCGMVVYKGFPYLDKSDPSHRNTVVMLQTVCENIVVLIYMEVNKAVLACKAQVRVGTSTEAYFIDMVS